MEIKERIKERFSKLGAKWKEPSKKRIYPEIKREKLLEGISFLFKDLGARFITATGLDTPEGINILYHFSLDKEDIIVSLRVVLDREKPEVDSITSLVKGAEWIEREIHEFLGVNFIGHPKLTRFLLPDDWPEGVYPYKLK